MTSGNNGNSLQQRDTRLFSYPPIMPRGKAVVTENESSQSHNNQDVSSQQLFFLSGINQASMMMHGASSSSPSIQGNFFMNREKGGAYDMGERDQEFWQYFEGQYQLQAMHELQQQQQQQQEGFAMNMRASQTLNMFPSQPMHVNPSASTSKAIVSPSTSGSKRSSEPSMNLCSNPTRSDTAGPSIVVKHEDKRPRGAAPSSAKDGLGRTSDAKTLRRLAQNREAAKKSRQRKKAYIQQLEASKLKLLQLESDLQMARAQGFCIGESSFMGGDQGLPAPVGSTNSDVAAFDVEYGRWVEEHEQIIGELKNTVEERQREMEVQMWVDRCVAHFDHLMHIRAIYAKSDPFHLLSGVWCTHAERCFLWIAGFRPSHLLKVILRQIQPVTEQQVMGVYALQQSTQEVEEALSKGLEALQATITDAIVGNSLLIPPTAQAYMAQMALAAAKLQALEGFVLQADNLRQQTIHRLHCILNTQQAARCFLAISEYFHRLHTLSTMWVAGPTCE